VSAWLGWIHTLHLSSSSSSSSYFLCHDRKMRASAMTIPGLGGQDGQAYMYNAADGPGINVVEMSRRNGRRQWSQGQGTHWRVSGANGIAQRAMTEGDSRPHSSFVQMLLFPDVKQTRNTCTSVYILLHITQTYSQHFTCETLQESQAKHKQSIANSSAIKN